MAAALKPFTWSFSSLTNFETCANKYAQTSVYKTFPDTMSADGVWGVAVHTALEKRLTVKQPLPDDMPFEKWARVIESMKKPDDTLRCEIKVALNRQFRQTGYWDKDVWYRGVLDLFLIQGGGSTAWVGDWKTGKVKDDPTQLKLFVASASCLYPDIERYVVKNIWLKHDQITPKNNEGDIFMREWIPGIWQEILPRVKRMEDAYNSQVFPMKPNGLCKNYCPVLSCPHNGRHGT
jgi:hypothetical protein